MNLSLSGAYRVRHKLATRVKCITLKILGVIFCSVLGSGPLCAQAAPVAEGSPEQVVQNFCVMDAEGKQLNAQGEKEIASLLAGQKLWAPYPEITIIKDYVVNQPDGRGDAAQVTVGYNVWGRVDSSLHFTLLGEASMNRPTLIPEYVTVVRSDKHLEPGTDGQLREVTGAAEWKIGRTPSTPYISVGTAIRYVREMGYRSKDRMVKMNAHRTLAELQRLYQLQALPAAFAETSRQTPMAQLSQFVALLTDGRGLTPDGLKQLEEFCVRQPSWRQDRIHVAKSYTVRNGSYSGNRATFYVEYATVGELDSSLSFTSVTPAGGIVREAYTLLFANYSLPTREEISARQQTEPVTWKIEDANSEQWITVNAAIRYVTQFREAATDPAVRANAEKALATLARYH